MTASEIYAESSRNRILLAALLGAENWLDRSGLQHPDLGTWLDHLSVYLSFENGDPGFMAWYDARPSLVEVQKGSPLASDLVDMCRRAGIPPEDLWELVFRVTDIVYAHLFGALQWDLVDESLDHLAALLQRYELDLPPLDLLPPSDRSERGGQGHAMAAVDVARWRSMDWSRQAVRGQSGDSSATRAAGT